MKHETLAPWAELVPGVPSHMTAEQLLALHDDAWQYELVDGRLVRMAPTGLQHLNIARRLYRALDGFVEAGGLGLVTLPDTGFRLVGPQGTESVLSPDIAFVSAEKARQLPAPGSSDYSRYLTATPDIVVEVASPDQYHPEMAEKAQRYLMYGVRLVWIVWPIARQVEVWQPGSNTPVATLSESDALDGRDVLPGFTHPVADLFA